MPGPGVPRSRRERARRRTASPDWLAFQARLIHPDQIAYEEVRPVVALGQEIKVRAAELGVSPKTLSARVERFVQFGIPGLVPHAARREDDGRLLPAAIRDHILLLKAQHPPLTPTEIAGICAIRFDREVNHSTVQRVLARSSLPKVTGRRYPRYHEMADGEERREALLRLHLEGWPVIRIAEYLGVSRKTVTSFLRHRWIEDGVAGLADKSRARRSARSCAARPPPKKNSPPGHRNWMPPIGVWAPICQRRSPSRQ
jgi:putative transposase